MASKVDTEKSLHCLPGVQSEVVHSILNDLDKQLTLIKLASVKSSDKDDFTSVGFGERGASSLKTPVFPKDDAGVVTKVDLDSPIDVSETILETSLEFAKLNSELTQLKELPSTSSVNTKSNKNTQDSADHWKSSSQFSNDVDHILSIIRKTKTSLRESNDFLILKKEIEKAAPLLNKSDILKSEIEEIKRQIADMKVELSKTNETLLLEEQCKVGEINRLKDEHHLTNEEGNEVLKFTDTYFSAQSDNMNWSHREKIAKQSSEICRVEQQIDRDIHCLAVMESWTEEFCENLETKISEWKLKLRRDELAMEMRIELKERAIKAQEELIKSLNMTIAQRLEELAPWEEEKEVERQERLAHMRRYYSARKIQRWWRAFMAKLKLYRKRKATKPKP